MHATKGINIKHGFVCFPYKRWSILSVMLTKQTLDLWFGYRKMGCSYKVFVFWDGRSNVQVNFLMTLSNVGVVLLTLMIGEEVSPWTNSRSGETWAAWPWARFPSVSFTAFFVPSPISDGLNKLCTNKTSVADINYQRYHCQALSFSRHCAFVYDRLLWLKM